MKRLVSWRPTSNERKWIIGIFIVPLILIEVTTIIDYEWPEWLAWAAIALMMIIALITVGYRYENLIDEAPLFSEDIDFDSLDHTLVAHFGTPERFIFKNYLASLVVSVSLPKGMTLENPEHVRNALSKLYTRVKYYSSL